MKKHSSILSERSIIFPTYLLRDYYKELVAVQNQYEGGIYSMESALFINQFIPSVPVKFHLSFAMKYRKNRLFRHNVDYYYVLDEYSGIGLKHEETAFGDVLYYYDLERTLIDIFCRDIFNAYRYLDLFFHYRDYPKKDMKKLKEYAYSLNVIDELPFYFS